MIYSLVDLGGGGGLLYADDTVIYCSGTDKPNLESTMNDNLKKLEEWCTSNRLTINSKKTKYVLFEKPRAGVPEFVFNLSIRGECLGRVNKYCYLGVTLDSSLTFKPQIDRTVATCNSLLFSLSKIRRFVTSQIAIQIYKSLIMSRLNYGGLLCIGASKMDISRLQKVQNRGLRICLCADRYTSNLTLHTVANVLPVKLRMKLDAYNCMYKR